ncbi:MAG: polyprenyl diphosphate synthase, partial [Armatimonadetes bacterium]|nr:polyprenyl diphosphate synthase [Armatimonadota bacterium]
QQRGLPRIQGHFEGRKATKRTVRACAAIGIEVLSLYAFSVENWRRPHEEVNAILRLIATALEEELAELDANNVRFRASGRLVELPEYLQQILQKGEERTADNTGLILNLCVNYGGRAEIVDAARNIVARAAAGDLDPASIDETIFAQHLYQPDLPDPDLLLRPGGETRVSNFLLWQVAYSEVIILPVLWPDFREEHLADALVEYSRRQRRFGGVTAQQ